MTEYVSSRVEEPVPHPISRINLDEEEGTRELEPPTMASPEAMPVMELLLQLPLAPPPNHEWSIHTGSWTREEALPAIDPVPRSLGRETLICWTTGVLELLEADLCLMRNINTPEDRMNITVSAATIMNQGSFKGSRV